MSDIRLALSSIRKVLPDHDSDTILQDWIPLARQALAVERQQFREDNEDSAGWGASTFSELSYLLLELLSEAS